MALVCAICNEVPEQPVVSPVSGAIFEKRLVEKYISENGADPINGQPLTLDQLIEIKSQPIVKPRPPTATSIPAILKILQDEWDAAMLHGFNLRHQLQTARQELSHALYQHDAACRVISRLSKELTATREALATLKPHAVIPPTGQAESTYVGEGGDNVDQPMEEAGMTEEVIQKLQDKAGVLTAARKQRGKTVPEGLVTPEELKSFKQLQSHVGLHSASVPGITCVDVHANDTRFIVTGGKDRNVVVFNKETEQVVSTLKGHQKQLTSVIYHPTERNTIISSSLDATIRVWTTAGDKCLHVIRAHEGPVSAISLHATGDYVLSASADEKWAFSDIRTGRTLCRVADPSSAQGMTSAQFHPDGLIFGIGTADAMVKIWDLKEQSNVANFPGHTSAVKSISFSENGYYLATAAEDAVIKLWDLRKLKNFKTITLEGKYEVKDLCFDQSGSYLAVAGSDVRVYQCKQWQELCIFGDHTEAATGVRFGENAKFIVSTGLDRSLRFYGM